jgi:hypothetical protein
VEFGYDTLLSITPFCNEAQDWAPQRSPFCAFTGDFDANVDLDMLVLGQRWNNGVPNGSNDVCGGFPRQSPCCRRTYDSDGNVRMSECYPNSTAFHADGQCKHDNAVRFDIVAWEYFVKNLSHSMLNASGGAWYLLGNVKSSPVEGKAVTKINLAYTGGAGSEVRRGADLTAPCEGVPGRGAVVNLRAGSLGEAPAPAQVSGRRIYQRNVGGRAARATLHGAVRACRT